jgi:hypothetical protein
MRVPAAALQLCFSFHMGLVENDVPNDPRYRSLRLSFAHVTPRSSGVVCCGYQPYVRCISRLTSYVGGKI